ncbi:hypothetical protein ACFSTH_01900 [Paenibacillus yanchengensis]|uniref:LiaF transmembrane domain-containing protein n=1 Tax=Paenibacillus yanchengensis TaxID=2035833 RepID=A0ABW4YRI1_9BACL
MNGKSSIGIMLIAIGGLAVLHLLGIKFSFIIGLLLPFILIGLGVLSLSYKRKVLGSILIGIGAIMLLGKLSVIFIWILAIGLVAGGVALIKNNSRQF